MSYEEMEMMHVIVFGAISVICFLCFLKGDKDPFIPALVFAVIAAGCEPNNYWNTDAKNLPKTNVSNINTNIQITNVLLDKES